MTAPPVRRNAPPPPVHARAATNTPQVKCPQGALNPCDVTLLLVALRFTTAQNSHAIDVRVPTSLKHAAVPRELRSIAGLLRVYDFVAEVTGDAGSHPANISATANYIGPNCSIHQHADLHIWLNSDHHAEVRAQRPGQGSVHVAHPAHANAVPFLDQPGTALASARGDTALFAAIASVLAAFSPRDFTAVAFSCGKRAPSDRSAPNAYLNGLIRVYRRDTVFFRVEVPACHKSDGHSKTTRAGVVTQAQSHSVQVGRGRTAQAQTVATNGRGVVRSVITNQSQTGRGAQSQVQTRVQRGDVAHYRNDVRGTGAPGRSSSVGMRGNTVTHASQRASGAVERHHAWELKIIHNGSAINVTETFERIKAGIERLQNAVWAVRDFFNKLPEFGWHINFDLGLFAGAIELRIDPTPAKPIGGRYWPLHIATVGVDLDIIDLAFDVSFGVRAIALGTGLILEVGGKLGIKASVGGTFELTGEAPHEIEFIGEATGELRAVGELDVLGRTVAGASAYVRTALAFDNGGTSNNPRKAKLVVGEGKVEVEGMLRSRGVILTASVKYPTSSQATEIDPITLFGPKTFCTFPHG